MEPTRRESAGGDGVVAIAELLEGLAASERGDLALAQARFERALRSNDGHASMETGHALRGLAELALLRGDLGTAEGLLKQAVTAFRDVARLQPTSRLRASEAEAGVLLLGAEVLLRRGTPANGEALLGRARALIDRLGDDRSAEAWSTAGRVALHLGDRDAAVAAFRAALTRYEEAENIEGHAEALLELALLERREDPEAALRTLHVAATMARTSGRPELLARVLLARAGIVEDGAGAQEALDEALERALRSGNRVLVGLILVAVGAGGAGADGAERALLAGAQVLLDAEHYPGIALALVRIAEHGLLQGDGEVVLSACEAAWRIYRVIDPGPGLGRVLGLVRAAFELRREPASTLAAAFAHAAVVAVDEPHTLVLRDHYAQRSPQRWVAALSPLPRDALLGEARRALQASLAPALRRHGLLASSFATVQGALDALGVLTGVSPRAGARQLAPDTRSAAPTSLAPARLPDALSSLLEVRTTIRIDVPLAPLPAGEPRARQQVFDPDGRLSDMVHATVTASGHAERAPVVENPRHEGFDESLFPPDEPVGPTVGDGWALPSTWLPPRPNAAVAEGLSGRRDDLTEEAVAPAPVSRPSAVPLPREPMERSYDDSSHPALEAAQHIVSATVIGGLMDEPPARPPEVPRAVEPAPDDAPVRPGRRRSVTQIRAGRQRAPDTMPGVEDRVLPAAGARRDLTPRTSPGGTREAFAFVAPQGERSEDDATEVMAGRRRADDPTELFETMDDATELLADRRVVEAEGDTGDDMTEAIPLHTRRGGFGPR